MKDLTPYPVIVSFRDGKFNVVDGQNRIAAMRQMAGGGDVIVPCMIYTGMTYEQEAELYAKLDKGKRPLTPRQHTKALVESGSDARIMEIKCLVEDVGFVWALGEPTGEPFESRCISTAVLRGIMTPFSVLAERRKLIFWRLFQRDFMCRH